MENQQGGRDELLRWCVVERYHSRHSNTHRDPVLGVSWYRLHSWNEEEFAGDSAIYQHQRCTKKTKITGQWNEDLIGDLLCSTAVEECRWNDQSRLSCRLPSASVLSSLTKRDKALIRGSLSFRIKYFSIRLPTTDWVFTSGRFTNATNHDFNQTVLVLIVQCWKRHWYWCRSRAETYDLLLGPVLRGECQSYIPNLSSSDVDPTSSRPDTWHAHEARLNHSKIFFTRSRSITSLSMKNWTSKCMKAVFWLRFFDEVRGCSALWNSFWLRNSPAAWATCRWEW